MTGPRIKIEHDNVALDHTMTFLLPAVKLWQRDLLRQSFSERVERFLLLHFDGYLLHGASVHCWRGAGFAKKTCTECRLYQVSFSEAARARALETFLAEIALEMGEPSIHCTLDGKSYLVTPRPIAASDS